MSILSIQAQRLAEDGLSPSQIEQHLLHEGNAPDQVKAAVASLGEWLESLRATQAASAQDSGSGAAVNLILGGVLLTLGVLGSLAGPKLFIGAIGVGLFRLVKGFALAAE